MGAQLLVRNIILRIGKSKGSASMLNVVTHHRPPPPLHIDLFGLFHYFSHAFVWPDIRSRQYPWRMRKQSQISWRDGLEIHFQTNWSMKGNIIGMWTEVYCGWWENFCFPRYPNVFSLHFFLQSFRCISDFGLVLFVWSEKFS